MARLFIFLNIIFILIATTTSLPAHSPKPKPIPNQKPHTFVFPVLRDTKTGLYYTSVTVGEPPLKVNLGVGLTGSALWFNCDKVGYKSTTSTPILCGSNKCKQTGGRCTSRNDTCSAYIYHTDNTPLLEDNVILSYTSPSAYVSSKLAARLPLACMPRSVAVAGLPFGCEGSLGLGSSSKSFVNRLVSSYKIPFKVALCLPSKPGRNHSGLVYLGSGPYLRKDATGLLVSAPLVRRLRSDVGEYFIDVKSIEVNGKKLSFNQNLLTFNKMTEQGGTTISTGIPYTILESSIYRALVKAIAGNAKKVKAVDPFSDCFSAESFGRKETPVISLVLGGGVKWKIYGSNSVVKVNKNVVCLGFMDIGINPRISIEIGGYQMQDNLVEFDLKAPMFSFTSSLLLYNTSCSRL